jgi:trk/ktr system potassium uptake protein
MTFRLMRFRLVLTYVGSVLFVFGLLQVIPWVLAFTAFRTPSGAPDVPMGTFGIPVLWSLLLGGACRWQLRHGKGPRRIGTPEAMLICVFGWMAVSAVGALPYSIELGIPYLDAYFEAMSGFTTTGITMLRGLDAMPQSLLMWRSMTQWIGGLGILSFFMFVVFQGGATHQLMGAESHKIGGPRLAPGMWNTLRILWAVYLFFTVLIGLGLWLLGTSVYDAISHAFTCISTGGYSPYDASIAYYGQHAAQYPNYKAIEYLIIFGMWAGGTSFLVHYRVFSGKLRALWDSAEIRFWYLLLAGSVMLVMFGVRQQCGFEEKMRSSLFQVVSIATTTGYATVDIADASWYAPFTRMVFLTLMIIGGCGGSTAGGFKIVRIVILWKLMARQMRKALLPESCVDTVLLDGAKLSDAESQRTAGLLFAWIVLLLFGSIVTGIFHTEYGALESASGMFSALGNIGPTYISVAEMGALNPLVKIVYIAGMLAGRLEIIPLLVLFNRRSWA